LESGTTSRTMPPSRASIGTPAPAWTNHEWTEHFSRRPSRS